MVHKEYVLPMYKTMRREVQIVDMVGRQLGDRIACKWYVYEAGEGKPLAYGYVKSTAMASKLSKAAIDAHMEISGKGTGDLGGKWKQTGLFEPE